MYCGACAQASQIADPCPDTRTSREWLATCFTPTATGRQVNKPLLKRIKFNRKGYAAIVITAPPELVSVNRRGQVVVLKEEHLDGFSFEPGDGEGEIARFGYLSKSVDGKILSKCGFYRTGQFKVIIPPVYDECESFNKGSALVCVGCTSHCPSGDCHESDITGDEGLVINEKNEIIKRIQLPSLPLCSHGIRKDAHDAKCRLRPVDPFFEIEVGESWFNKTKK